MSGFEAMIEEVRFGEDSPLEEDGSNRRSPGRRTTSQWSITA
jgi:hypothetical protein